MIRAALIAAALALATPAIAAPNAQLVRSVQHRLNILGFQHIDAGTLSTMQISALHMKLQGPYTSTFRRVRTQQEVKVILGWEKKDEKR